MGTSIKSFVIVIVTFCIHFTFSQLLTPPAMIEKEIMGMSRARVPWILAQLLDTCDKIDADKKSQLKEDTFKCLAEREKYIQTSDLVKKIQTQCSVFKKGQSEPSCYDPLIIVVRACHGVNTDYFQFTKTLLEFVCLKPNVTASVIENQVFQCYESHEIQQYVAHCMEISYRKNPFDRKDLCRAFNVAEDCMKRNFLAGCTENKVHYFFESLFEQIRQSVVCDNGITKVNMTKELSNTTENFIEESTAATTVTIFNSSSTTADSSIMEIESTSSVETDNNEEVVATTSASSSSLTKVSNIFLSWPNWFGVPLLVFLSFY